VQYFCWSEIVRDPVRLPNQLDERAMTCRAIVECPPGSRSKFDYDPESGLFELAGVLPAGMAFPLAFGFVPSTLAEDGDPVDVLILADEPLPVGCLLTARLLGVIEAEQTEDGKTARNDRLVAKVAQSHSYADINSLDQLGKAFLEDLKRFFITYNDLKGQQFEVVGVGNPHRARELVAQASR
jgi:inorganic pyrophosphatase